MAKGAATENALGALHAQVSEVFRKVLLRYEANLAALDTLTRDEEGNIAPDSELLANVLAELGEPNPAMLAAITKFLKDNSIAFDSGEIADLSDQERRLEERRKKRVGMASLATLQVVSG